MHLYRICPEKFLENYSGLGASYREGARWNSAGLPVLYFALSPATALLEMANYLPSPRLVPLSYRLGIYEIADDTTLENITYQELPEDWAQFPYPASTQKLGDEWLNECSSLGLVVPSTAVSAGLEKIVVLNPNHPAITGITLRESLSELFNKRSFSGI